MTENKVPDAVPFWRRKRLEDMTVAEWESLCDGCGRCCLQKVKADDDQTIYSLDLGCELQDTATGLCSDYANRLARVPVCYQLTPAHVPTLDHMPPTCGYMRVLRGEDLDWWHPLVSGDPNSVRSAGMSAGGRFIDERRGGTLEYHTVDWPLLPVTTDPAANWKKAMFGGVNASVPTPFGPDNRVDLDLMAQHCFWLLANGCNGLAVLDKTGEVASLAIAERIEILDGLLSRGVPVSKLLAGIGPAAHADSLRIATHAHEIGIRGVMLSVSVPDRVLPSDVLPTALIAAIPERLHLYLSFSATAAATSACMTALDGLEAAAPGRLRGIRDETPSCDLAKAALDRFGFYPFEVYIAEPARLAAMTALGGAGLIGPGANLQGLHCAGIIRGTRPEQRASNQRAIEAVGRMPRTHQAVSGLKALIARHTGKPQWGRVRLPLRPFGHAERLALYRSFDACGVKLSPVAPAEQPIPLERAPF